mgnify:CR=1 FL=1
MRVCRLFFDKNTGELLLRIISTTVLCSLTEELLHFCNENNIEKENVVGYELIESDKKFIEYSSATKLFLNQEGNIECIWEERLLNDNTNEEKDEISPA